MQRKIDVQTDIQTVRLISLSGITFLDTFLLYDCFMQQGDNFVYKYNAARCEDICDRF